jgi:phage terminase large subunit-like protein
LETISHVGSMSRAADIGDFAERVLGLPLMGWQLHCLEGLTAFDDDGRWLHRVGLISVARQNGKSLLSSAVIGHWLTKETELRGQPQTVISVSHKLDLTAAQFSYLAPILADKFGATVFASYGRQKVTMPNGSVWHIRAATPAAGHGYSADLITADEVWQISEAAIDDGLLPSQRARKNPLCLMVSTAGTQESTALLRWRDAGLRAIDSRQQTNLYFAEFSPPPTLDPMTPAAWEYANPALAGGLIDLDVIEGEALGPNRSAFLRASVNLWQAVTTGWLEAGVFEALKTDVEPPPGGVLAIESSTDEARYTAVRAVQTGDKTHVCIAFTADSMAELWRLVQVEIDRSPTLRLAIIPALEVHCPPALERRRTIVGYRELLKWTAAVRSMILEKRLTHSGELLLQQHVERAVLIKHNGSVALSSSRSPGPIEAARCMVWAAAMASRPQIVGKPVFGVAS